MNRQIRANEILFRLVWLLFSLLRLITGSALGWIAGVVVAFAFGMFAGYAVFSLVFGGTLNVQRWLTLNLVNKPVDRLTLFGFTLWFIGPFVFGSLIMLCLIGSFQSIGWRVLSDDVSLSIGAFAGAICTLVSEAILHSLPELDWIL